MIKKIPLGLLASAILVSSCLKDEYDFEQVKTNNYNPTIGAPLLNANVELGNLLTNIDTSLIQEDENNLLTITISDTVTSFIVSDLVEMPTQEVEQEFKARPFNINDIGFNSSITLQNLANSLSDPAARDSLLDNNGESTIFPPVDQSAGNYNMVTTTDFTTVTLSEGTLSATITNNWPVDLDNLIVEVRNISDNSLIGTLEFGTIPVNGSSTDQIDLAEKTLTNQIDGVITNVETQGSGMNQVLVDLDSELDVAVLATDLVVVSGEAILPDQAAINESFNTNFEFTNGENLQTVRFKSGVINYTIDYGLRENSQIILDLPFLTDPGGNSVQEVIDITSDHINPQVITGTIDLADHEIDMTGGGTGTNVVIANINAASVSSGIPVPFDTSDAITSSFSFENLDISYVDGYLGNITEEISADTFNFEMFDNEFSEMINLADPRLTLNFNNSAGIPLDVNFTNLFVYNESNNVEIQGIPSPLSVEAPDISQIGTSVNTSLSLNNTNSNVVDVLNSNPSGLGYAISVTTNPDNDNSAMNFISDESKMDVTMDMDIPMYGSVEGFVLEDTLDFSADQLANVKEATIKTIIENELPVDLNVQLYFTDDNYNVLDSLFDSGENLVVSSIIDQNGEMTEPSTSSNDIVFSESKINSILETKHVLLKSTLSTGNGGAQAAKFYTHYQMSIRLGIIATIQLNN